MYTELSQWLPVSTPQGNGFACGVIDYSQEAHLLWVCILDETGEIWCVTNGDVRVRPNPSMKARRVSMPHPNSLPAGDPLYDEIERLRQENGK